MNEPMVTSPRIALNMDVLLAIISLSPPKTATSIIATCRFLYHEGAKVILRWPIRLYGSEQDLPLLRFIQAEDLSRCSYVRNLTILVNICSEAVASILAVIVPRMSSLEYLCLRGSFLFKAFPYLLPAFASLRSLKTLIIDRAEDKSFELVRTIQSDKLVVAKVLFCPGCYGSHSFAASNHPIYLLRRWASTLLEVECGFWRDTHTNIQVVMSSPQIIYPNVHSLILRIESQVAPCLPPYIHAFPNLIHLRVEGDCYLPEESESQSPFSHESQHQTQINMAIRGLIKEPMVWKHLQAYTGTLPTLRALRITFPIPRLYFTYINIPHDGTSWRLQLISALAYARPIHLTITFEDQAFFQEFSIDFLAAMHSDGASGLESLSLTIDVTAAEEERNFNIDQFWTSIETVFLRLQLRSLDVIMRDISVPKTASTAGLFPYRIADAEHRARFTLAERTLEDLDVRAFVGRLTASIPTLQHAMVSIERPSRWAGGIMRTARLGKHDDKSKNHTDIDTTENVVLYEEYRVIPKGSANRVWDWIGRAWQRGRLNAVGPYS